MPPFIKVGNRTLNRDLIACISFHGDQATVHTSQGPALVFQGGEADALRAFVRREADDLPEPPRNEAQAAPRNEAQTTESRPPEDAEIANLFEGLEDTHRLLVSVGSILSINSPHIHEMARGGLALAADRLRRLIAACDVQLREIPLKKER
jgi:hypothetical protein